MTTNLLIAFVYIQAKQKMVGFYEVDKERYDKIKNYMNDKGELELL